MVFRLADNVLSPLGETTEQNYQAVLAGRSALRRYDGRWGLPEPFCASLFDDGQTAALSQEGLTRFESLAYGSARRALAAARLDASRPDVVFILSTTKGNIEQLGQGSVAAAGLERVSLSDSACRVARRLGVTTTPLVVCNACISGVSALWLAARLLRAEAYRYAVVCGADVQSAFTVAGFQSLKSVDRQECRPFDIGRLGLNLGEAAATMVLTRDACDDWAIEGGAVRNDAFHVSSPSRNGEGACQALEALAADPATLAFINAHGTATLFNDQMESVAIVRAGLSQVPVNALKGYFGHTLGAAGVLETIISMRAADDGIVLATRGYEERGVSGQIRLSAHHEPAAGHCFVKMISGFGGGNGALLLSKGQVTSSTSLTSYPRVTSLTRSTSFTSSTSLTSFTSSPSLFYVAGRLRLTPADGTLTELYRRHVADYPKFYKMDGLSRLGFMASEMLLRQHRAAWHEDAAVILFNHSSSIAADRRFQASIADRENFFPSPSVFVYTLPNMVTGEIAIRNGFHGETAFYVLPRKDERLMHQVVGASLAADCPSAVLAGWLDYEDDEHYEAELWRLERKGER